VDHNRIAVCQFQPDDLEEVAGIVRSDGEYSRRVGVGLKIDDRVRVADDVADGHRTDAAPLC
jgi:hypothetical protein